jgi:hypothetical protein
MASSSESNDGEAAGDGGAAAAGDVVGAAAVVGAASADDEAAGGGELMPGESTMGALPNGSGDVPAVGPTLGNFGSNISCSTKAPGIARTIRHTVTSIATRPSDAPRSRCERDACNDRNDCFVRAFCGTTSPRIPNTPTHTQLRRLSVNQVRAPDHWPKGLVFERTARSRHTAAVRLTDFWWRMGQQFGPTYAQSFAHDFVLGELGGRTIDEALAQGVEVQEIWRAVCRTVEVAPKLR